jgi:hypothetical protein
VALSIIVSVVSYYPMTHFGRNLPYLLLSTLMSESCKNHATLFRNFLVLFVSMFIFKEHTSGMISECLDKHAQIG